jgi:hypothetical protein
MQVVRKHEKRVSNSTSLGGCAACWIGLGVSDVANPWVTVAATVTFGAIHSAISPRFLAGRQRTSDVKVRADAAGRRAPALVFAGLVGLVAVTIRRGIRNSADGAEHPATMASSLAAVSILPGGPRLMAVIRADAIRRASE